MMIDHETLTLKGSREQTVNFSSRSSLSRQLIEEEIPINISGSEKKQFRSGFSLILFAESAKPVLIDNVSVIIDGVRNYRPKLEKVLI